MIVEYLVAIRGYGGIAPPRDAWRERNLVNAADAAIESLLQLQYMRREGVAVDGTPFAARQIERTDAIFQWLGGELTGAERRSPGTTATPGSFGLAEISVICALDWMELRHVYPTERAAALAPLRQQWRDRHSIASTRPHD